MYINNFKTPGMCSNISGSETDVEAILLIAKKIREEIDYNEGEPLETQFLGLVLRKCPLHVERFIRKEYGTIIKFLKTHCEVFWIDLSRKMLRVNVAPKKEVNNYISFLKRERLSRELFNGKGVSYREKEAIIYFSNIMRAKATKNCSNIVTMKEFEEICRAAPHFIQDFVSDEFKSLVFVTNFDNFIKRHHQIFPETKSGRSLRVKPETKVTEYIAGLLNNAEESNYNDLTGAAVESSHLEELVNTAQNVTNSINQVPPKLNNTTDAKTTNYEPFTRFEVSKHFNLQDFVNPTIHATNSTKQVLPTGTKTTHFETSSRNDTSKGENIKLEDKPRSKAADQTDHFEELCSQLKAEIQNTIIEKKSKSYLDFSTFHQKSSFNPVIEPDNTDMTFVEGNYAYDNLLQDLFSKTILNSASDSYENLERNGVNRNIECQTISSGQIFITQLYQ